MLKTRRGDIIGNVGHEVFLRIGDVQAATGLGRSTIYRLIILKRFPPPVKPLGPRVSAWLGSEILAWQKARIAESRSGAPNEGGAA